MSVTAVPIPPTRRRILVMLWVGIIIAIAVAVWLAFHGTAAVRAESPSASNAQFLAYNATQPGVKTTKSGLEYQVLKAGEGSDHPTDDDVALITYSGKLRDGTVFQTTDRPTPLPVAGSIPGFSEALKLMTKGAKYRVWIKPDLAYGDHSPDPTTIPNGAMLVFDLDLIDYLPQSVVQQRMQMQQMMQGHGGAAGPGGAPGQ